MFTSGDSKSMPPSLIPIKLGPTGLNTSLKWPSKPPSWWTGSQDSWQNVGTNIRSRFNNSDGGTWMPPVHNPTMNPPAPMPESVTEQNHNTHNGGHLGMGLPPPATLTDPSTLPGTQVRGTGLVTIIAVDDPDHPKFAVVAVNNKYPFEGGYAIPAGAGPFAEGPPGVKTTSLTDVSSTGVPTVITPNSISGISNGMKLLVDVAGGSQETVTVSAVTGTGSGATFTATFTHTHTHPFPIVAAAHTQKGENHFYYYANPKTQTGGSICHADLDKHQILSFTGDESTTAPTPYYKAIADHRHDGNLNPDGYDNADPVNIGGGEIVGNLPYANNSTILFGVVDSDGNVIGTEFPNGGLTRITSSTSKYAGMYRQDRVYVFDSAGFDLSSNQWLWTDWRFVEASAADLGPMISDGNDQPVNTKSVAPISSGAQTVTPVDMTGIYTNIQLTVTDGVHTETVTVTGSTSTTFNATFVHSYLANVTLTTSTPPSNFYKFLFGSGGTNTLKFYDINGNVLQTWSMASCNINSSPGKIHYVTCGIQYVGGTTYRVSCHVDGKLLIDVVDDGSGHTGSGYTIGSTVFPGFFSANTRNTYFRWFDFHTTDPNLILNSNPNGVTAPVLTAGPSSISPVVGTNKTTFDQYVSFTLDSNGQIPAISSWGGKIVLMAKEHGNSNQGWGEYGTLAPTTTGIYNGSSAAKPYAVWSGLGLGSQWDLGIAYIDQNENLTNINTIMTVTAPGLTIDSSGLIINHTLPTPTISGSATIAPGATETGMGADMDIAVTITNLSPLDGSISHVAFYFKQHTANNAVYVTAGTLPMVGTAGSNHTYNFSIAHLHNGTHYDFAVGYFGIASGYGPLQSIGSNVAANTIVVSAPYLKPHGGAQPPPNVTITATYPKNTANSTTGVHSSVDLAFTITNQPTTGALRKICIYAARKKNDGSGNFNIPTYICAIGANGAGSSSPPASAAYSLTVNEMVNGVDYAFFATFESVQGDETVIGTTHNSSPSYDYPNLSSSSNGYLGSITAQNIVIHPQDHQAAPGGTTLSSTVAFVNYTQQSTSAYHVRCNFSPTITLPGGGAAINLWLKKWHILGKINDTGTSDGDTDVKNYHVLGSIYNDAAASFANGQTISAVVNSLSGGHDYQIALQWIDDTNKPGPVAIAGITQWVQTGGRNLIVDAGFRHANFVSGKATTDPNWRLWNVNGTNAYIQQNLSNTDENSIYIVNGFTGGTVAKSRPMYVQPDKLYTASAFVDSTNAITGGTLKIVSTDYVPAVTGVSGQGTVYASISQNPESGLNAHDGFAGRIKVSYTVAHSGVAQVCVVLEQLGLIQAGGARLSEPMFELGAGSGVYTPGPDVTGVTSVLKAPSDAHSDMNGPDEPNPTGVSDGDGGGYFHHKIHSPQVIGTIDYTAGGDGIFFKTGQINSRHVNANQIGLKHITGDTSGDTSTAIFNGSTKQMLHARHSVETLHVITSVSGNGQLNVNPAGGVTSQLPHANHSAQMLEVIANSSGHGQLNVNPTGGVTSQLPHANHSAQLLEVITNSGGHGQVSVNPTGGVTGNLPYTNHNAAFKNAVDSSSNLLHQSWGGSVKEALDGTLSGFTTNTSVQGHTFAANQKVVISGRFKVASGTPQIYIGIGTSSSNMYRIIWDSTARLSKVVSGSGSQIGSLIKNVSIDTNWHSFTLTVTCSGASSNTIEGSVDDAAPQLVTAETALDLTTGTWNILISDGNSGTTKFSDLDIVGARAHHTALPPTVQHVINSVSGNGQLNVNPAGGVTSNLPYSNHDASVTGTLSSSATNGLYMKANQISWKHFLGDSSTDTTTNIVDAGNKRFLHAGMSTGVQTAIDSSGNLLNISWTGISVGSGGAMTGFASGGTSSTQALTLKAGHVVSFEAQFKMASTTAAQRFILGNATNGYAFGWTTGGALQIQKIVSSVVTGIQTLATVTQDTLVHSFKLTVTVVGASSNKLEASFDNVVSSAVLADAALDLTAGTWTFTIVDGNNGTTKVWNFQAYCAVPHRSHVHTDYQTTIAAGGTVNVDLATSGHILPYLNHHAAVTTALDNTGRVVGNVYDGATSLTPANFTNVITNAGKVKVAQADSGSILPFANHHGAVTGTFNSTATSGLFMKVNQIAIGHFLGDTSADLTTNIFNGSTKQMLHARHSVEVNDVITSSSSHGNLNVNPTGGVTSQLPHANHSAQLLEVITNTGGHGQVNVNPTGGVTGNLPYTNHDINFKNRISGSGGLTVDTSVGSVTGNLPHVNHSTGVQGAVDSNSNVLNNPFPTGTLLGTDGSMTGFTAGGVLSNAVHTLIAGEVVQIHTRIKLSAVSIESGVFLGSKTNGYGIRWETNGAVQYGYYASSVFTSFGTIITTAGAAQDTSWHTMKLTITCIGASSNKVEASFDSNVALTSSDTHLDLTAGTWGCTIFNGTSCKVLDYRFSTHAPHHTGMSSAVQSRIANDKTLAVDSGTGPVSGQLPHANHSAQTLQVIANNAGNGQLNVNPTGGVTSTLPYSNHDSNFRNRISNAGALTVDTSVGSVSGILPHANHAAAVTSTFNSTATSGLYMKVNQIAIGHFLGDTSADLTTNIFNGSTKQMLHARHSVEVNDVITSSSSHGNLNVNPTGGVTSQLPHANHSAQMLQVVSNNAGNGQLNVNPTGGVTSNLPYTNHDAGIKGAVNSDSTLTHVPFSGLKRNTDTSYSGLGAVFTASAENYTTPTGTIITVEGQIKLGATSREVALGVGPDTSNNYRIRWGTAGGVRLTKRVATVGTDLSGAATVTQDATKYHTFKITIKVNGASSNTIEGSFDGNYVGPVNADTALDLTAADNFIILETGGTTDKLLHFKVSSAIPHHQNMSTAVIARIASDKTLAVDSGTGPVSGNLPWTNHDSNFKNRISNAGALTVDTSVGSVSGILPHANHSAAVTSSFNATPTSGLYMKANQIAIGHFLGDTSGDLTTNIFNGSTKNILHARHSTETQAAVVSGGSGAIAHNPFGAAVQLNTDMTFTGFTTAGLSTAVNYPFPTNSAWQFTCNLQRPTATTSNVEIIIGNTTNGFGLSWSGATLAVTAYKATVKTTVTAVLPPLTTNGGLTSGDTGVHNFRIGVCQNPMDGVMYIEASVDTQALLLLPSTGLTIFGSGNFPALGTIFSSSGNPFTIIDATGAHSTKFFGIEFKCRDLFMTMCTPYINAINVGSYIGNAPLFAAQTLGGSNTSALNQNAVDTQAIQAGAINTSKIGTVTVDSLTDSTYARVLATQLTSGAVDLTKVAPETPWTATLDGSGALNIPDLTDSSDGYSFAAGQIITFNFRAKIGGTAGSTGPMVFYIGTVGSNSLTNGSTNCYGFRWTTGGVLQLLKSVAGTVSVLQTGATVTQDNLYHHLRFRLTVISSGRCTIDGTFDNNALDPISDTALNMTSGIKKIGFGTNNAASPAGAVTDLDKDYETHAMYFNSGAPTFGAVVGSLCSNYSGGAGARLYYCTVSSGTWVAATTP